MYAMIYDQHGHERARFVLGENDDVNDCGLWAVRFGNIIGADLEPNGEDYYVVIQEEPGAVRYWKSEGFAGVPYE